MKKSKILGIALAAAMVSSIAATAALSASATVTKDGIDGETVGITGSFCNWGSDGAADVPMTLNNGVWEGQIQIPNVTDDMLVDATMDDGKGTQVARTDITGKAITFKIRTNGDWKNSWGDYEPAYERTWNSQTNCAVAAEAGKPLTINVKLDTTKQAEGATFEADDPDIWQVWAVTYEVVESAPAEAPATESEAPAEDSAEAPAAESEAPAPVATGDTTSAVALVAVVIASLGAAVVMTKKASAKD